MFLGFVVHYVSVYIYLLSGIGWGVPCIPSHVSITSSGNVGCTAYSSYCQCVFCISYIPIPRMPPLQENDDDDEDVVSSSEVPTRFRFDIPSVSGARSCPRGRAAQGDLARFAVLLGASRYIKKGCPRKRCALSLGCMSPLRRTYRCFNHRA